MSVWGYGKCWAVYPLLDAVQPRKTECGGDSGREKQTKIKITESLQLVLGSQS